MTVVYKYTYTFVQITDIALFSRAIYKCTVDEAEYDESFPILPSQTGWCKVYKLRPLLANNRHKRGLALDGKLKHEDTNLASSTIDVSVELPFTLTHPKPDPEVDVTSSKLVVVDDDIRNPLSSSVPNDTIKYQSQLRSIQQGSSDQNVNISDDLIKLDDGINENTNNHTNKTTYAITNSAGGNDNDDDLIFEDFARLRLKNYESDKRRDTEDIMSDP
ncbi:Beta-arrestin-1 [Schistosoma japonicum]|nr:Beta-arrestin-1 [Schistosoma japonicum]